MKKYLVIRKAAIMNVRQSSIPTYTYMQYAHTAHIDGCYSTCKPTWPGDHKGRPSTPTNSLHGA
jgi:hypothetical protein